MRKQYGLSVIVQGQDKGKSYIEHTAEKAGTSYKAKLKAAIDRLIPQVSDFEELLKRLEVEGYEIKRGKYISCRATGQERFTRLKTLGMDYTEEAVTFRIAGGPRPSKQPKLGDQKISLLIDIQNNLKAQESSGYAHWAKINNLKEAARTFNFITEHGITHYEQLQGKVDEVMAEAGPASCPLIKEKEHRHRRDRSADQACLRLSGTTDQSLKLQQEIFRQGKISERTGKPRSSSLRVLPKPSNRWAFKSLPDIAALKKEIRLLTAEKQRVSELIKRSKFRQRDSDVQVKRNVDQLLSVPSKRKNREESGSGDTGIHGLS